jgi:diphosphomevalonate decarboxylase
MQVTAQAHPNIALIKYWGKADLPGNVPAVPSLSVTLGGLTTRTEAQLTDSPANELVMNGSLVQDPRVLTCIDRFRAAAGCEQGVRVTTQNDFPTAAGLASSASGFAALVGVLNALFELNRSPAELSVEARRGSASAARSIHGGFVSLTGAADDPESWQGRPVASAEHWPLEVVVAICSTAAKPVSSSEGMRATAATSPYYDRWVSGAHEDYQQAYAAIQGRDFDALAQLSESSCLKMHALMLSTKPALLYWNAATLACIERIRGLQAEGTPVFFTIDAGPQLKAVCLPEAGEAVAAALSATRGVEGIIRSPVGGAMRVVGRVVGRVNGPNTSDPP